MRALEVVRAELDALGPDAVACADAREALRGLAEQLGAYDVLADEIDAAIDEDALSAREEQAEKAAALAAELGERAASRAMMETSTSGRTAGDEGEGESLWGEAQAWVIRPECVLLSLPLRFSLPRASQLTHLPTPSFSTSLAKLHADLASLREQAAALQDELRARYKSKNLTLKVAQRVGPAVHIFVRDGVKEIDKDPAALVHQKTNSTRLYVNRVRLSLPLPAPRQQQRSFFLAVVRRTGRCCTARSRTPSSASRTSRSRRRRSSSLGCVPLPHALGRSLSLIFAHAILACRSSRATTAYCRRPTHSPSSTSTWALPRSQRRTAGSVPTSTRGASLHPPLSIRRACQADRRLSLDDPQLVPRDRRRPTPDRRERARCADALLHAQLGHVPPPRRL